MIVFLDSSALAKRYVREAGTDEVLAAMADAHVVVSRLAAVEVASALAQLEREGGLAPEAAAQAAAALAADLPQFYVVEIGAALGERATMLLRRHSLRALDALQLASVCEFATRLGAPVAFYCYDARLAAAARHEGLDVRPAAEAV